LKVEGGIIRDSRLVCGAVACTPWRLTAAENALRGGARDAATADRVAVLAAHGAQPLNFNGFKVPLLENLVRRAIRGGGT
ncbi:MAG: hypothetical protein RL030_1570, partial [Pseudomonadota bacterium]